MDETSRGFDLQRLIFFSGTSSELWACANGQVHIEFYLMRNCLTFSHEGKQVPFENRSAASAVQVKCLVSKSHQKRAGCTTTGMQQKNELETGRAPTGAFEGLFELVSVPPQLPGGAPFMMRSTSGGWKFFTRSESVAALRLRVGSSGRDPMQFALHTRRIEGGHPVSCARPLRLANPTGRNTEVSGFNDVCE